MDTRREMFSHRRRRELEEQLADRLKEGPIEGCEQYEDADLERLLRWLSGATADTSGIRAPVRGSDLQRLFDRMAEDDAAGR